MAKKAPSVVLRARIIERIAELNLMDFEAAEELGLSPGQVIRLRQGEDLFTFERTIDAAAAGKRTSSINRSRSNSSTD